LPLLTELFLRECDLGDDGAAALCLRMIGRRLTALGAAGNDVTADGAGVLAVSNWPCLTRLDLSENPIEDNGARFLAVAPGLANLAELALNDCGIGADGVAALADSVRLPGLRRLELDGSAGPPISEEAAAELARGPISGGLTRLTLRRRRLTEAARQLLRRRFGPRLHLDA
jgi:hypothetical protein